MKNRRPRFRAAGFVTGVVALVLGGLLATAGSSAADPDTEAPTAPTNLRLVHSTPDYVDLEWDAATDNVGVTTYNVVIANSSALNITGYTFARVPSLSPERAYTFTVQAHDAAGNTSPASNEVTRPAMPPPDPGPLTAPTDLHVTGVTATTISLAWSPPTGSVGTVGYDVYSVTPDGNVLMGLPVFDTNKRIGGLATGRKYEFFVVASDTHNVSPPSNHASAFTANSDPPPPPPPGDNTAPTVPSNLQVVRVTATTVTLTWNLSTDESGVRGYEVFRVTAGGEVSIATTTVDVTTILSLTPGTDYVFVVRASDGRNISDASSQVLAHTADSDPPPDTTPPSKPTNVHVTSVSPGAAVLAWDASTDDVGVLYYVVFDGEGYERGRVYGDTHAEAGLRVDEDFTLITPLASAPAGTARLSVIRSRTKNNKTDEIACSATLVK